MRQDFGILIRAMDATVRVLVEPKDRQSARFLQDRKDVMLT